MTGGLDATGLTLAATLIDRLGRTLTLTSAPASTDYDRTDGSVTFSSTDYPWVAARITYTTEYTGGDAKRIGSTVYYVPAQSAAGVAATFTPANGWIIDGRKVVGIETHGQDQDIMWVLEVE